MVCHEHNVCLEACLSIFFPPIAVWVHQGECCSHVLVNWLLNMLSFGILGMVHAVWFCFVREDDCVLCGEHHNTVVIVEQHVHQPAMNPCHADGPPPPAQPVRSHPNMEPEGYYDQPPPAYNETPYTKRGCE
uniref:LITAF domain-containing protein n=1 Tax=Steinernema glaseri TaxID=37863 RepID=A0A1I8AN60_9BILA